MGVGVSVCGHALIGFTGEGAREALTKWGEGENGGECFAPYSDPVIHSSH